MRGSAYEARLEAAASSQHGFALLRHILEGDSGPHAVILPTEFVIRSSA
jgi:hypothetical protein